MSHHCLPKFLKDETVCFVGTDVEDICTGLRHEEAFMLGGGVERDPDFKFETEIGVELRELATTVLKKLELFEASLTEVGNAVSLTINEMSPDVRDMDRHAFTPEQVKKLIHNAYAVGKKLLAMI